MNKELEEAIKRLAEINEKVEEYDGNILKQDIETVLNYIENSIPKQLVEEKLKEIELPNVIVGGRRNSKTLEYGKKLGKIEILKELLEGK